MKDFLNTFVVGWVVGILVCCGLCEYVTKPYEYRRGVQDALSGKAVYKVHIETARDTVIEYPRP